MSRLTIKGLSKAFTASLAVDSVNLDVAEGEFVSLLGPSGCGKTTTLRCVAGLEIPTAGKISFGDRDVTLLPPEHRGIGMVFQNYALFPHMSVVENIHFGLEMRGVDRNEANRRVDAVMEMVQLVGFHARFPGELSGGQQQRVALARALVVEPSVLLLDEPLANLDAKLRDEMRLFIRALQKRIGITTLYVTHDQAESMTMSDRIVVMFNGRIHQIGTPEEIYGRPSSTAVASFIGLSNFFDGEIVSCEGDMVSVKTRVGTIKCWAPASVAVGTSVAVGMQTKMLVRPESIRLDGVEHEASLRGRVLARHFSGNLVDYRIGLAGDVMVNVQALGTEARAVGDEVNLTIDSTRVWLLP